MRASTKLDRLERLKRSSEHERNVAAISKIMDECAAAAMGGAPSKDETLTELLERACEKHD